MSARAVALVALFAGVAAAQPTASCDLIEISATTAKEAFIDKGVQALEPKLKKPPFSSWNSFKVLSTAKKTVTQNKPDPTKLTHGTATILLSNVSSAKPPRISLTLTLDDAGGVRVMDTKLSSNAGEWTVVGRSIPKSNDGELLALSCN
jgi:hypothetical protein